MSKPRIRRLPTGRYVRVEEHADGTITNTPVSQEEQIRLVKERDNHGGELRKNFTRGVTVGGGIAAAELATGALGVAEVAAAAPAILTVAAVGAAVWGCFAIANHFKD